MNEKEFERAKELAKIQENLEEKTHKDRMEEAEFVRKTELLKHNWELERLRIKSAEIRKNFERKSNSEFLKRAR